MFHFYSPLVLQLFRPVLSLLMQHLVPSIFLCLKREEIARVVGLERLKKSWNDLRVVVVSLEGQMSHTALVCVAKLNIDTFNSSSTLGLLTPWE